MSWFFLPSSMAVLQPAAWDKKGRDLGLIIDLVLLSMELSGNLTQYESGSAAG